LSSFHLFRDFRFSITTLRYVTGRGVSKDLPPVFITGYAQSNAHSGLALSVLPERDQSGIKAVSKRYQQYPIMAIKATVSG